MPERQLRMIRSNLDGLPEPAVPDGYVLRAYRPGDEAAWADIMNTGIGSGWTAERCAQDLTGLPRFRPDGLFFITCRDEPVGSACAWPDSPEENDRAQVHMVCVVPAHRGKGLGRVASLAALRYMREHGFKEAYLATDDFRLSAVKEYLDLGFEPDYVEESHRARWARVIAELGLLDGWRRHVRPEPRAYHIREAEGNRALLVLLDRSRRDEYNIACRTVISTLYHLDIPYRAVDLASVREPSHSIMGHQAVVLAQERIGDSIPEVLARRIAEAVRSGVGLVGFDHRIDRYPEPLLGILPVEGVTGIAAADRVTAPESDHFIVRTHEGGKGHPCRRPVELTCVESAEKSEVLLEAHGGIPALVTGRFGAGNIVQYLIAPKFWTPACYGHGEGLDDVFWKSIVWASRKPFVMKAMPPFVTVHVSGASGAADGFAWVTPLLERGWHPHIGFLTEEVHEAEWQTMAELAEGRRTSWFPQALTTQRGIFFHHPGHRSYGDAEIEGCMAQAETLLERRAIPVAASMAAHHDEYGRNAVPLLRNWNVRYLLCPFLPNEAAGGDHLNWEPGPYGHPGYILDDLFGFPALFVATARPDLHPQDGDLYTIEEEARNGWDCLRRATEKPGRTDDIVEEAAQTAARAIWLGLDNRFFGVIATREKSIARLPAGVWTRFLGRVDELLSSRTVIRASQDFICEYARSQVGTHLACADYDRASDELRVVLSGRAAHPLHVQVFDEACKERTIAFEAFEGRMEKRVRISEWAQ